jgi:hypothetical protein
MKNKYIIVFVLTVLLFSCTDNFEDYNTDKKNPEAVAGEMLFSNAQKELSDQLSSTSVNQNVFKLWAQYWTETQYTEESNYNIAKRPQPDWKFRVYYRQILTDLQESKKLIAQAVPLTEEERFENANKIEIIEMLTVFAYQNLVDIFGMVPYSEALDIDNLYPAYDDGLTIYRDLIVRLDAAIAGMDATHGSFSATEDFYYHGNVNAWIKFANTLKIKLAINLSDVDLTLAGATITSALAGEGVFTSSIDDATMTYKSAVPNTNPLYVDIVLSGRDDFVPANTLIDTMNALNDPRRAQYFTLHDTSSVNGVEKLAYVGGRFGYTNSYLNYSHINPNIYKAEAPGLILTYTELLFYLAEAAERGFTVPLSAEEYYNDGIVSSFDFWGATDVATYLANPDVAYSTAPGTWKEKICLQSWLAFYTRGDVAWNTYRRLDGLKMNIPRRPKTLDGLPPRRFTFPIQEQSLNKGKYDLAAEAVGGDFLETRIFWDLQ